MIRLVAAHAGRTCPSALGIEMAASDPPDPDRLSFARGRARASAAIRFRDHRLEVEPARSFRFRHPEHDRDWFQLTWVRGAFHLSGALGELSLKHYEAVSQDFDESVRWLATANTAYLLGRSTAGRRFDAAASLARIKDQIDQELAHALRTLRHERRTARRDERPVPSATLSLDDMPALVEMTRALGLESGPEGVPPGRLRRRIHGAIDAAAGDGEIAFARLVAATSLARHGGSLIYDYPERARLQIAAMRWAAEQLLARPGPLPFGGRAVGERWLGAVFARLAPGRRRDRSPPPAGSPPRPPAP
jgi:hypothetical protein